MVFLSLIISVTVLFFVLKFLITHWRRYWIMRDVPGHLRSLIPLKDTWALFNELNRLDSERTIGLFKLKKNSADQYRQQGIYLGILSINPVVDVFRADLVEQVLKDPAFEQKAFIYEKLKNWLGNGLLTSFGAQWKVQRRMMTPSVHFAVLNNYFTPMNAHCLQEMESVRTAAKGEGKKIEVSEWATDLTMAILFETLMGFEHGDSEVSREYINSINEVAGLHMNRILNPLYGIDLVFFNSPDGKRYQAALEKLHKFIDKAIQDKIAVVTENPKMFDENPKPAFLDLLVKMYVQEGQITLQEMRDQVNTFMFAGHDTTGWGIAWALFQIGHMEDVQEKLREELREVFGEEKTTHVTAEHLRELQYFERVLKETQRCYPSIPGISRKCSVDNAMIGGYSIAAGTTIAIDIFALHRDPAVFPDPEKFDADRFLPENSQQRHPFAFLPFSAGPRNCIGQRFAQQEMRIVLVNILRNFKLRSLTPLDKISIAGEIILRAKEGLPVEFIPI